MKTETAGELGGKVAPRLGAALAEAWIWLCIGAFFVVRIVGSHTFQNFWRRFGQR